LKNTLLILLFLSPLIGFSQQFLWSTTEIGTLKNSDVKLIPITEVSKKVIDYYEFYEYYYDLSGFTRTGLEELLKKDKNIAKTIQWDSTMTFDKPVGLAFKTNEGRGSMVVVMLLQKENIDVVLFTNEYGREAIVTHGVDKFKKWFSSFWDYSDKINVTSSSGEGNMLVLANSHFEVRPSLADDGQQSGRVTVEFKVNRQGQVTYARAGVNGTTISSRTLLEKCERAVLEARVNALQDAPDSQTGVITFNFKLR